MSLLSAKTDQCPEGMVLVESSFCMDKYEWPNKKNIRPMIAVSGRLNRKDQKPMDATRLCESVGKRVCEASEWIRACRGPAKKNYYLGEYKTQNDL